MWGSPLDAELGAEEGGDEAVAQLSSSNPFFIIATTVEVSPTSGSGERCPGFFMLVFELHGPDWDLV
jgi:hypothetical protein